jgi:hypothetical protein
MYILHEVHDIIFSGWKVLAYVHIVHAVSMVTRGIMW